MQTKTILVTGSTDGIGKQTALELAETGHHVIVHGRNAERTKQAAEFIRAKAANGNVDFVVADFSSLENVKKLSDEIHSKYEKLDVLLNNAGVFMNERKLSRDGFEMTFAINHLAHFLLTELLMDLIGKAPQGRIVNVASMAHANELDFENLQGEKFYDGYTAYSCSKLCNILFTYRLAEDIADSEVTVNCLHPGVISTKLLHAGWGSGGSRLQEGSTTSVYLATSPDVKTISGKYFSNSRQTKSSAISYNRDVQKRLWELSEVMSGVKSY
ncbi:MAG: SDR family oxidoreductase [Chlorobi bacterium]|nr:SDR family oxidoreductase [Chlorobiota bacterium]